MLREYSSNVALLEKKFNPQVLKGHLAVAGKLCELLLGYNWFLINWFIADIRAYVRSGLRTIRGAARLLSYKAQERWWRRSTKKDQQRWFLVGMRSCYDRKDYELAIEIITICNQEMLRIEFWSARNWFKHKASVLLENLAEEIKTEAYMGL